MEVKIKENEMEVTTVDHQVYSFTDMGIEEMLLFIKKQYFIERGENTSLNIKWLKLLKEQLTFDKDEYDKEYPDRVQYGSYSEYCPSYIDIQNGVTYSDAELNGDYTRMVNQGDLNKLLNEGSSLEEIINR